MKIVVGSDHGGYILKEAIKAHLIKKRHEVIDVGTNNGVDSVHYSIYGIEAATLVAKGKVDLGMIVCTTGEGIMIAANKVKGIRCGICYDDTVAKMLKEHNNANMIAFGQKTMLEKDVLRRIDIFLDSKFEAGRHQTRLDIISEYENNN